MFGIGNAEVIVLMLLSGGTIGLPVGIPPGEVDPLLANIAPAECLYYTSWAGMAAPSPTSKNECEQLLREPEVKRFVDQLDQLLVGLVTQNGADPAQAEAARQGAFLGKLAIMRPTAIFVSKFKYEKGAPFSGQAAIVVNVGDRGEEVTAALAKLLPALPVEVKPVTIAGATFQRCDAPAEGGTVPVTFGVKGKYLIVGAGANSVEGVLARAAGQPPEWLTKLQQELVVPRQGVVAYADVPTALELAAQSAGPEAPLLKKYFKIAGLDNVTYFASATGLTETGCVTRSLVGVEGKLQGFLKLAEAKPLAAEDIALIPANTSVALAVRLDPKTLFEMVLTAIAAADDGETPASIRDAIPEFERQLGIKLADVFDSLGDTWTLYDEPGGGGLLSGWTASVNIRDRAKAQTLQEHVVALATAAADVKPPKEDEPLPGLPFDRGPPKLRRIELAGQTVFHLRTSDPEMPLFIAWCLTEDRLTVALTPQSIQALLTRPESEPTLASRPEVTALLSGKEPPVALGYVDAKPLFRWVYPFILMGAHSAASQSRTGMDLSLIPSGDAIARHMRPMVQALRRVPEGIEVEQHQSFPGSGISAAMPLLPVMMIPAVFSAREAASRTREMNNMRQLALALLNFEAAHGAYPAAYNTTKDGKPLLSWRVHMLPYLEEELLYREFHLDEPWDSDHNKKLVERMPDVFQSPKRAAPPGETYYQGVRGKETMLIAPAKEHFGEESPKGTRIADVVDGTSNTILLVEAKKAVPWTKPDDVEYDPSDPGKGVLDPASKGFSAAMSDGSVRLIHSTLDLKVLKQLLERADGEPIPGDF